MPLSELRNQRRAFHKVEKTYGKKKGGSADSRALRRELFVGEENGLEQRLATLKINENDAWVEELSTNCTNPVAQSCASAPPPTSESQELSIVRSLGKATFKQTSSRSTLLTTPLQKADVPTSAAAVTQTEQPRVKKTRKPKEVSTSRSRCYNGPQSQTNHPVAQASEYPIPLLSTLAISDANQLLPLLQAAKQKDLLSFQEFGRKLFKDFSCTKIGEGSYGDVYSITSRAESPIPPASTVIKIIPIDYSLATDSNGCSTVGSVLREISAFELLAGLHGFTACRGVRIVHGTWPPELLQAFSNFKQVQPDAQKPDPREAHPSNRIYALIEMDDAGIEINALKKYSVFQITDILWQTVFFLAYAEQELEFEHRDLHNSNVCIGPWSSTDGQMDIDDDFISGMTEMPETRFGLSGLRTTIIDYTLSRARAGSKPPHGVIFSALSYWHDYDEKGQPPDDILQNRTYKRVCDLAETKLLALVAAGACTPESDKFSLFIPQSNVFWASYLLNSMLNRVPSNHRAQFVPGSSRTAKRLQIEMWAVLREVKEVLAKDTAVVPRSARELLQVAVEKAWLSGKDVETFKQKLAHA